MSSEIERQVTALIASTLRVDEGIIRRDTNIVVDLAADSLLVVALILALEEAFQIDIHDEDAAEILTVEQLIEYVAVALAMKEALVKRRFDDGKLIALR